MPLLHRLHSLRAPERISFKLAVLAFWCLEDLAPTFCLTVYSMSPIFQADNVCVARHQRILPYHKHVSEQSTTQGFVLRRQKPGTVFRQKWRHQWHCRHININLKLTFFTVISRHVISPHFSVLMYNDCNAFAFVHKIFDWLIDWLNIADKELDL